jgi:hypothetical protein
VDEEFELEVPPDVAAGVYSDYLHSWFTAHELVLDVAAPTSADGVLVSARVRVPATAAVDLANTLADSVRRYELEFGEIHRPRRRGDE